MLLLERDGNECYNAAVLVGQKGLIGKYRKNHLPFLGIDRFIDTGKESFQVYETPIGNIGIHICYDCNFPESARIMALLGADIIALPTNWPQGRERIVNYVVNARAYENRVHFVAANRVGSERGTRFMGRSKMVSASGDTLAEASNDYLQRNVTFGSPNNSVIHFKDVILDAHEFFVLKLLVLHPASEDVCIEPVGHISGMQRIIVREPFKDIGRPGFWTRTFTGAWGVQVVRLIAYTLLTILIILLIVIPSALIGEKVQEIKRRRHVRNFKATTKLDLKEDDEFVFGRYVNTGLQELFVLQNLCKSRKSLLNAYRRYERMQKRLTERKDVPDEVRLAFRYDFYPGRVRYLGPYIEAGFIHVEDGKPTVDEHMSMTVEHFIRFLRNSQIIKDDTEADMTERYRLPAEVLEVVDEEEVDAEPSTEGDGLKPAP